MKISRSTEPRQEGRRRLGFAVKVLGREGLPSHDARRWRSNPDLRVSLEALRRILAYLDERDIRMYRMSSDFVPYGTHPDMPQFHRQLENNGAELESVGRVARDLGIRLSLHPSQYVVLNAEDGEIARKAQQDLDMQARLLDLLGQGPEAVVVLHVGGTYGDKRSGLERFARRFEQLTEPARRRLVIENDESFYDIEDCLWLHARLGVSIVFDHHHHRLNTGGGLDIWGAARAALATWPRGVVPKMHFSSPRLHGREVKRGKTTRLVPPLLRQHADYLDPWTFAEFLNPLRAQPFDVMLEAKAKDLALLKLHRDLEVVGEPDLLVVAKDPRREATPAAAPFGQRSRTREGGVTR